MYRFSLGQLALFLSCVAIPLLVGWLGARATTLNIPTWYAGLAKPSFNPPNWVFAPVWTCLYLLMGIALFLVVRHGWNDPAVRIAIILFAIQLLLNGIWTPVFFSLHQILGGLVIIVLLAIAIVLTAIWFYRISPAASWLMAPYLLWVCFATVLNAAIFRLNR